MKNFELGYLSTAIIIALLLCGGAHYTGLCIFKMKHLSSSEKIEMAIKSLPVFEAKHVLLTSIDGNGGSLTLIPYKNVGDFMSKNPGCCSIVNEQKGKEAKSLFKILLGEDRDTVLVKYQETYLTVNKELRTVPQSVQINLNVCGKVISDNVKPAYIPPSYFDPKPTERPDHQ